jgi:primosomal protein N' (replication factor Y)
LGDVLHQLIPKKLREGGDRHATRHLIIPAVHQLAHCENLLKRAPKQFSALRYLIEHGKATVTTLKRMGITTATLKGLEYKGLIQRETIARWQETTVGHQHSLLAEPSLPLTDEQTQALNCISAPTEFTCYLLDGVTGSGKTEVYLQAIENTLASGKQTLVLVPEINLTPQTLERFKRRFNVPIVPYHSQLTDTEKFDTWLQASCGHAHIIIGTRSATLMPLKNPGLIIVDEEHDGSFKQQEGFRYHARDTAVYRAHQENIPIILGSATPSLESLHNALTKRYQHLRLVQRPTGHPPPTLECIDIRGQTLDTGISQPVIKAISKTIESGHQALVFLNRRGFAPVMICRSCGQCLDCAHCSAHLTWHRQKSRLKCHHCLHEQPLPKHCTLCGSEALTVLGQGTERIESRLQEIFPKVPVIRVDRDTTSRKSAIDQLRSRIAKGQPIILVGTQMLSKGHHFPKVTLSVILDGDTGLLSVDFRGTERLAQLITQVAGRSGRGKVAGRVLIQTLQPDHPALQQLQRSGYAGFAKATLQERVESMMPPFGYLALVRAEAQDTHLAEQFLRRLKHDLSHAFSAGGTDVSALGPVAAPLTRRAGYHRQQLLIHALSRSTLHKSIQYLTHAVDKIALPASRLRWSVDIDPLDLY